jgi:type IV secretion system protein VirB9
MLVTHPSHALQKPEPTGNDSRIKTVIFDPNEVYKFKGHYGYQSTIEFAQGEEILTISVGDSIAWLINPAANRIFIKPIDADALTNMTVVTNFRTYHFELHADEAESIKDKDLIFSMRFIYPDTEQAGAAVLDFSEGPALPNFDELGDVILDPQGRIIGQFGGKELPPDFEKYNFRYSVRGSEVIEPMRIFDDGQFTYFEFREHNAEVPAFFAVEPDGSESIVNYRTRENFIIIERVEPRYTLRLGGEILCVYNDRLVAAAPNAGGAGQSSGGFFGF